MLIGGGGNFIAVICTFGTMIMYICTKKKQEDESNDFVFLVLEHININR